MAQIRYRSAEYKYYVDTKKKAKDGLKRIYDRVHLADYVTMSEIDDFLFYENYDSVRECTRNDMRGEIDWDTFGFYDDVYDKVFIEEEGPESLWGKWSIVVMNPRPIVFNIGDYRRKE